MRKFWLAILCIFLIIAAIFIWVTRPETVDWTMTAYLFAEGGTAQSSFPITIKGKIQDDWDNEKYVNWFLDIDLPDDFRYSIPGSDGGSSAWKGTEFKDGDPNDLRSSEIAYDKEANSLSGINYVINAELGYFLAYWDDEGFYMVAATDPNVTVSEVLAHFQPYCELWGITSGA